MSETVIFTIGVGTRFVGSNDTTEIEVEIEELEGVPEEKWDDYVWENLGGKEAAFGMVDMWINHNQ